MARPERNNVDYFPFLCKEGKAMFYIEQKYGNDGYATWVKLLRQLAVNNYHYINLNDKVELMFLASKCNVSEETLKSIILDLCNLGEFNLQLWTENMIIWSDKFVEHIKDAYEKRRNKCIDFDGLLQHLSCLGVRKPSKLPLKGVINPQTKEDYTKEDYTKENNKPIGSFNFEKKLIEYGFNEKLVSDWLLIRKRKKAVNTETSFKSFITQIEKSQKPKDEILEYIISRNWIGFEASWIVNNFNSNTHSANKQDYNVGLNNF